MDEKIDVGKLRYRAETESGHVSICRFDTDNTLTLWAVDDDNGDRAGVVMGVRDATSLGAAIIDQGKRAGGFPPARAELGRLVVRHTEDTYDLDTARVDGGQVRVCRSDGSGSVTLVILDWVRSEHVHAHLDGEAAFRLGAELVREARAGDYAED